MLFCYILPAMLCNSTVLQRRRMSRRLVIESHSRITPHMCPNVTGNSEGWWAYLYGMRGERKTACFIAYDRHSKELQKENALPLLRKFPNRNSDQHIFLNDCDANQLAPSSPSLLLKYCLVFYFKTFGKSAELLGLLFL